MRVFRALLRPCARAVAQRPARALATRAATQRPSRALAARRNQTPRLAARALSYPAHEVVGLPALSPTMEVGTIQKWHVEEGASFGEGDTICEIETDKATIDFTAQDEGVVARLLQPEGVEISIGTPILVKVEDAADVEAFADFEAPAAAGASKSAKASTSAASSTLTRIGVPMEISTPSGCRSRATTPSSWAVKSIVALSVSISQIVSPSPKLAPSSTCHFWIVPTSIVGDSAGRPTTSCAGYESARAARRGVWLRRAASARLGRWVAARVASARAGRCATARAHGLRSARKTRIFVSDYCGGRERAQRSSWS